MSLGDPVLSINLPSMDPCLLLLLIGLLLLSGSLVPSCGAVVRAGTVEMVRSAGVFSGGGVVMMGTIRVTTLHLQGLGDLGLPPSPEAASPSSEDSSRTVYKDGDLLCIIPTNMVPKSSPSSTLVSAFSDA
jgi:hypothetical protein